MFDGGQAVRGAGWVLAAYLIGSISFGWLLARWRRGVDPRTLGSGTTGATNVARLLGIGGGIAVGLLDFGKGLLAVLPVTIFADDLSQRWLVGVALAVVCGHVWPLFHRLRGGKGVATAAGVMLVLSPAALLGSLAIFLIVLVVFRIVSIASLVAALSLPLFAASFAGIGSSAYTFALIAAPLILWAHRENLKRLREGSESRFGS